ncbi:MAG: hypothetical protein AABX89_05750 [Candidatus Thermoplasmatota archaeon]
MNGRAVAWLAYIPLPGLFLVPLLGARGDRLARFHALQGGVLTIAFLVLLMLSGFYAFARNGTKAAPVDAAILSALLFVVGLAYLVIGAIAAARGRFTRLRPVWDLAVYWL